MKGVYILLIRLNESQQIYIGRLGVQQFSQGFYAYVGSALNGIESRVNRHLGNDKKHFWHIDYLLDKARVFEVVLIPTEKNLECTLAMALNKNLLCIRRFGSSDCKCPGHLFFASRREVITTVVLKILSKLKSISSLTKPM